jgi:hypothetical protein
MRAAGKLLFQDKLTGYLRFFVSFFLCGYLFDGESPGSCPSRDGFTFESYPIRLFRLAAPTHHDHNVAHGHIVPKALFR